MENDDDLARAFDSVDAKVVIEAKKEKSILLDEDENSDNQIDPLEESLIPIINVEDTFWHMKHRQWSRLYRASYGKPRAFSFFYLFVYLLIYGVYLGLQIEMFHKEGGFTLEYILMGFITIGCGLVTPIFGWFVRVVLFEIYGYLYAFFLMNLYNKPELYIPLSLGGGGLVFLTMLNFFFYPIIVRAWYSCTGRISPKVNVSPGESGATSYEIEQTHVFTESYKIVFEGSLKDGKPSGLGTWLDTSYQGELLRGYWNKGLPIGPFESMENDTRNMLVNLRIIFGSNGGGQWFLERTPLSVGVAWVETCVSGNFFKGYPIVGMINGPTVVNDNYDAIKTIFSKKQYIHIDEEKTISSVTVSVDKTNKRINVTGHQTDRIHNLECNISLKQNSLTNQLYLSLDQNWKAADGSEGILFIHGIYHTLDDALKRFGQFLALGHFPAYLKPFLFNWPASTNPLLYWCASSVASDNDTHRDLKKFILMLERSGIKTLHIMCHSMGSRFFLRSFPIIKECFKKRLTNSRNSQQFGETDFKTYSDAVPSGKGIFVPNLVLMNPDYETETFLNDHKDLQAYIANITVYADSRDAALKMANRVTGKQSLGLVSGKASRIFLKDLQEIDIIDTADLDRNMNSQFHGYFNINRMMVDDLHELITCNKRAEERNTRLKPYGGVYRFTIVPSTVVMV